MKTAKDMASILYFGEGSNYEVFNGTEYFMLAVEDSQAESFKVTGYTGIFKENEHNDDITVESGAFGLSGFSVFLSTDFWIRVRCITDSAVHC